MVGSQDANLAREKVLEQEATRPFRSYACSGFCSSRPRQAKVYRVGVIHEGGLYAVVVDGLKDGLKELGFAEGKQYVLEIRDLKDRKAAEEAGRSLEREKVDLIYALSTSVTTVVRQATVEVPIVFVLGGRSG
jgi:ABC-type uncharacterized transport system substrate-binding protein